ncbi:MAG: DUF4837 family protein [Prevotella sp.]|nr:DUF4837 family protein [Prevotella sp.]
MNEPKPTKPAKIARALMLTAMVAMLMLTACGRQSLTPKSGGRPYEVVVVGDEAQAVRSELQQSVEVLPQEEPQFDVRAIRADQYNLAAQTSRSIVVTAIDPHLTRTTIRYERDAVAKPQIIIYLTAPSSSQLLHDAPQWGKQLRALLNRHETNIAVAHLRANRNAEAEKRISETFGVSMNVPADLVAWKQAEKFLWFSTNATEGVRCICLYTIRPGGDFASMRDSVMKRNLPGETDSMYVQTRRQELKAEPTADSHGIQRTIWRGLWEMKNDAMGGPFVARVESMPGRHELLVAEAFVYAPETTKRNKMRLTEAALWTLQPNGEK